MFVTLISEENNTFSRSFKIEIDLAFRSVIIRHTAAASTSLEEAKKTFVAELIFCRLTIFQHTKEKFFGDILHVRSSSSPTETEIVNMSNFW